VHALTHEKHRKKRKDAILLNEHRLSAKNWAKEAGSSSMQVQLNSEPKCYKQYDSETHITNSNKKSSRTKKITI
jgi:hypothetical protein